MAKVTIQDIAKKMGLSRNTVAKALSDGAVSPETKLAVIGTAWEMGYAKLDDKLLAQYQEKNKRHKGGTILVLFNQSQSVFWSRVMSGMSDEVRQEGCRMQLHIVNEEDKEGKEVLEQLAEDVRGIICLCVFPSAFIKGISKAGLPMTFFNTPVNAQDYIEVGDVYSLESFYSMNKLTSYCIEKKGCQSFAFIGFAEGSRGIQARYLGFLAACNQHGIVLQDKYLFTHPSNHIYFGYSMVEEAIRAMDRIPDAIICENDDIAKEVALILLQKDAALAQKIVITGFDGTIEEDFFKKDILTVEVRMEELGRRLIKSIIDKVNNPEQEIAFVTLSTRPVLPEVEES